MAHKNLLSDRKIFNQVESTRYRKPSKCWAMKKVRFKTKEEAERNAGIVYSVEHLKLYTYLCKVCHYWHLTKEEQTL